ncbi:glycosyltransferase family 4 protein [Methanobacterium sp. CWC-01]|uniref:glycosyltransferase family 4 protein n=1 Tax=Methanobacterium aridiramus TaxID=2584467 RepID=UPI002578A628|nr:glycosyltransferase family 4 protein [Methanobacterium sp. CWC-01]WJI10167.1 glycosyltransferase family 4 protein [Methanobacterium sp. CWC-01]
MQNSRNKQFSEWGGDTTQITKTKFHLEKKGLIVDINSSIVADLSNYDLVHIFNIQEPENGLKQSLNAKKNNLPITLSPIYWDLSYGLNYKDLHSYSSSSAVRMAARVNKNIPHILSRLQVFFDNQKQFNKVRAMLQLADIILPNSYAELEILIYKFKMPELRKKALIVPNCTSMTDFDLYKAQRPPKEVLKLPDEYVLQVGRLETWKGQLNLIKALFNFPDIPLVFIGNKNSFYAKECIKSGKKRGNTYFLNEIPHEDLHHYYSRAKIHALPSLRDSPGLSTLEAASFGVNCVVSIHGPITEYFGFDVFVCDPQNIKSIQDAVFKAWKSPKSNKLKNRILHHFTWNKAADMTLKAYKHVLKSSCSN